MEGMIRKYCLVNQSKHLDQKIPMCFAFISLFRCFVVVKETTSFLTTFSPPP